MLTVRVFVNNRIIAEAAARNVSELAAVSDYDCRFVELDGPFDCEKSGAFKIKSHNREQSCWALVEKIAQGAMKGDT